MPNNHTGSIVHRSVGNRDGGREAARVSTPRTRPRLAEAVSRIETVPGYRPLSRVSPLLPALAPPGAVREVADGGHPLRVVGRPLDAAEGGLRTTRLLEVVLGHDDRTVVPDPTASPWRHICALRIRTSTGKDFVGTGWFIGPRTVMTAGHCVFMRDEGGWVASIDVIPALDGTEEPYDHAPSTNFKAVREWTEGDGDSNYDFGAILLDKPLGEQTGWFAFASLPDTTLSSTKANISGYPADRDNATRQYYHARKLLLVQPQRLVYDIDTYGGQSGSAIWLNLEGDRIAVGIHTTGASTTNSGTRITDEVFAFMERWRQDAGDTADTHDAAAAVTKGARGRGRTSRQSEPKSTRKTTYRKGARRASPGAESKDE